MPNVLPFALVFILSLAQFFSGQLNIQRSRYKEYIASFAAAIAITYLLFSFLPEAYNNSSGLTLFVPLIMGFALVHLLEKFFYKKYSANYSLKKEETFHDEIHALVLFIYHFVIGAVLIGVLETDLSAGFLFLPPLLLFTTIGNWSLHHTYLQQIPYRRLLLASSTMFGALFAQSSFINPLIEKLLVNFAAGILLFIVVRESLPQKKEGKPMLFILGIILYGLLILLVNQSA